MSRFTSLARRHGLDVLIVIAALQAVLEVSLQDDPHGEPWPWFAAPAMALLILPLLGRRRFPFAAPAALWLIGAAISFFDGELITALGAAVVAGMASAFFLGNLADKVQARIGLVVVLSGAAIIVYNDPSHSTGDLVFTPSLFAIAWLAGYALRERSQQAEAAEQRAAQAEREREAAARVAVAEERSRIARELHDIVAHSVSVMVLQVGAVRHKLPAESTADEEALRSVEQTGRAALAEMRRLLGAMHDGGGDVELAPQPGLDSLDSLVEKVRLAGLPVEVHVEGDPFPLPRALDLSAYRIVQEGLTNALKHAGAGQVDVTVRYGDGRGAARGARRRRRDDADGRPRPRARRRPRARQDLRRRDDRGRGA